MKKLLSKVYNMSIMWKFSIIYFLLIMVPIFVIIQISYNQFIKTTIQQNDKEMYQRVSQSKYQVLNTIENTESIANEMIFMSESQGFLNNQFTFSEKEKYYFTYNLQNMLIRIKQVYPNQYFKIRFFSSNDSIGEMYDVIYDIERLQSETFYPKIKNSKKGMLWGNLKQVQQYHNVEQYFTLKPNADKVVPFYQRIESYYSNEMIGVLEIDILVDKMFGGYYPNMNSNILVLDSNNKIINSEESYFEGKIDQSLLSDDQGVRELMIDNRMYRIVYDTVESMGYKILELVEVESLLSSVKSYKNRMFIIMIFAMAGVFFFVYTTTNLLFSRLKVMINMMNRIQKGELDVKIDENRKDEIGQLAHNFNLMAEKLQEMISNLIEKETAHRDAEIRALQAQVNPHFLYNTLDSIRMQCEINGEYDIADVLISLSNLFRYNTKWTNELVLLKQEIDHVLNYITIMKTRFKNKIHFEINMPDQILNYYVIKMMIQPIIENSFKYAFNQSTEKWEIFLEGYILHNMLYIQVKDNGSGIEKETLETINNHLENNIPINRDNGSIGLWNVSQRIRIRFGDEYGIRLRSKINEGTTVIIKIPLKTL